MYLIHVGWIEQNKKTTNSSSLQYIAGEKKKEHFLSKAVLSDKQQSKQCIKLRFPDPCVLTTCRTHPERHRLQRQRHPSRDVCSLCRWASLPPPWRLQNSCKNITCAISQRGGDPQGPVRRTLTLTCLSPVLKTSTASRPRCCKTYLTQVQGVK